MEPDDHRGPRRHAATLAPSRHSTPQTRQALQLCRCPPFTHLGGYQVTAAGLGPAGGTDAEHLSASRVTAGFFATLGVAPLRGRLFTESDDRPGAAPVALIGERLWARKYGGDAGIVGQQVDIDGVPHEILGIVPADVDFPTPSTEIWVPMQLDPEKTDSASFDYQAVARLRSGLTCEAAAAELETLLPRHVEKAQDSTTHAPLRQR
jgi:putative ABC transport system permease protein